MAAKILHSLTDENPDLQSQIGCMTGIFQLFDRQHVLTGGARRIVGHTPKRLPLGNSQFGSGNVDRESNSAHLRAASLQEKYSHNIQDRQRVSTESSRASFSSSSRSSSFSSLDCNRATQLEPASFDRIVFPETPSRDSSMTLQNSSPQYSRQRLDLRDLVKDSMYRELTTKSKAIEEANDSIGKFKNTIRSRNEPFRSSSYHSKDESLFSVSKDAHRFSYDGREINCTPFDSRDVSKTSLSRLSLDSWEGSMWSFETIENERGEFDRKILSLQQALGNKARPPSVVAKLMGLEILPDSVSSSRSFRDDGFANISKSFASSKEIQEPSFLKNLWKEPSSPHWKNPDPSMKLMSRLPVEPAPCKQMEGMRGSFKRVSVSPSKSRNTVSSVYNEIEKRLKDLKFMQSGKDLRALQQILETMQTKGLLENQKEEHGSDRDEKYCSVHDPRLLNNRKPQNDQTKRRVSCTRNYESPIVIMKPAKLVEKSGVPGSSVISLDGLSGLPKFRENEYVDNMKSLIGNCTVKDQTAGNSVNMKNDTTLKTTTSSQQVAKDSNVGMGKISGTISPRMKLKKIEMDKRSRPPTSPDSRKQSNKQQVESNSSGGRHRSKNLSEISGESRKNEISVQSHESMRRASKIEEVGPRKFRSQNPSKASDSVVSGLAEKKSGLMSSEEESAEFANLPSEYSSPVSVLDDVVYKKESPTPVKFTKKTLKVNASVNMNSNSVQGSSVDNFAPTSIESGPTSEINQKKLQNIENLVQKLRRLNSSHDEARTDYIASLCENTDPDHRYISEILLASGLLLRDLGSSLTNFQFHPSGYPINPELFLVLEQTKASKREFNTEKTVELMGKEKSHRKLVFDTVNEILAIKLAKKAINAQKLLRELCSEVEGLQGKKSKCSSDEEDERWKNILCRDVDQSGKWIKFDDEVSDLVLDIERLIFKDLVNDIVIGESAGMIIKPDRLRQLFSK